MTDTELDALARRVGEALAARGWRLASAESCTGGWIAEAVTAISGSSAWFDRGFVTYSNAAKMDMLGVSELTLAEHGAVSEATVREMTAGALARSLADVAVAVSGIAGPTGGTAAKPVGMVCIGWAARAAPTRTQTLHFAGDRAAVRRQTVIRALDGILHLAAQKP
ncbi:nicotinamide-nucleotide amidohydrolase family protein [Thauera sp.]|jgi:nicotinamide-nucleotide amidase|uniref:CinA family protein n=1 Tax=Thauera sp. TaxID=1905334 RepID=UPI002A361E38|nr:nicotinamide-nucleotide amidohydrolase family protein [Thauera sp.]MDX9884099.1 nicotinamide-nucleotide amidohydrolase family protein [Thauera sp.]